jgi:hypothetical protein
VGLVPTMSFPHADPADAVLDLEERILRPADAPDDGDLDESPWQVTDESSAAWALSKIRQARGTARRRNADTLALIDAHEAAIAGLREVVDANDRQAQGTVDWFTVLLTAWHRRVYEADDDPQHRRTTSIRLAGGVLKSRQSPGKVEVTDVEVLPEEFRRIKVEADKRALVDWIKSTGEVPPGTSWQPGERRFEVDV